MIAVSHPGKIGDALYTLPTIRELSKIHNCKVDFYTSEHCRPIKEFMKIHGPINECIIPNDYIIERYDMGIQPWLMPIDENKYEKVYHLGFRQVPDKSLPEFIAETAGLDRNIGSNIQYNYSYSLLDTVENYIIIAPRGETSYSYIFKGVIDYYESKNIKCYIVGGQGDYFGKGIDYTHLDFNGMANLIADAKFYLGIMSAPLVIANGFNIPKIIPYNNNWDMRHIVQQPESYYLFEPLLGDVLKIMDNFI
jgi:ADP-heptose:LPS heptosyltransferase